ncbi:hypothetical protein N0V88_002198 [Collariella sp. IMI 366227]|nr:hypothetical protein N0V88_002198 [Collariella sp. IMI 366227]
MFDTNPNLIQEYHPPENASPWTRKPTPLVLIHDGGGTIFSYYCLSDLGRPLYGISNPRFQTGNTWEGGIPQMTREYIKFIKKAVPKGDIIIGGWSLGGLISLEVARQLAEEENMGLNGLNLLGIVMVDSVCPLVTAESTVPVVQHAMQWGEHTKQDTKEKVMRCFVDATRMVREWTLPIWGDEETQEGLITKVLEIPGHHFNIFHTEEALEIATAGIKKACLEIEALQLNHEDIA